MKRRREDATAAAPLVAIACQEALTKQAVKGGVLDRLRIRSGGIDGWLGSLRKDAALILQHSLDEIGAVEQVESAPQVNLGNGAALARAARKKSQRIAVEVR